MVNFFFAFVHLLEPRRWRRGVEEGMEGREKNVVCSLAIVKSLRLSGRHSVYQLRMDAHRHTLARAYHKILFSVMETIYYLATTPWLH